jgi:hypothetical protein
MSAADINLLTLLACGCAVTAFCSPGHWEDRGLWDWQRVHVMHAAVHLSALLLFTAEIW